MITLTNVRRAIYNICKRLDILEQNGGGSSTPIDISGKQDVIDSSHKLSSDLVDDDNKTHKFVTSQEKDTWNGKSDFSGNYNDLSNKPTIPSVPSNESAVSGGSTLSLVTTGDKYNWNNKANIWRGTQAQYDAITTPDNNTIYIIIEEVL